MVYPAKRKKESPKKEEKAGVEAATDLAFRFLSYRPRSAAEVRKKLAEAGVPPFIVEETIARIEELGYLNDYAFARTFASSCIEHKLWGPSRIRKALLQKGVAPTIISSVIQELAREHDFCRVAQRALRVRLRRTSIPSRSEKKARRRLIDYLLRKGFDWSTIADVITVDDDISI